MQSWGGGDAVNYDCACARAREGLYSFSPSPALPHGTFERVGGGVGETEVGGIKLKATPTIMAMMTLTVPTLQTPICNPDLDHPPTMALSFERAQNKAKVMSFFYILIGPTFLYFYYYAS